MTSGIRLRSLRIPVLLLLAGAIVSLTGCGHRARVAYGAPPAMGGYGQQSLTPSEAADWQYVDSHQPIYTQVGLASWYGPYYNGRRGANGQVYNENALSAANLTLPLNSLIKVTNLATGQATVVRVTDRGPFIPGRILDLSKAAALQIGLWREGVGRVRMDVYYAPLPIWSGGRWCVQVGAYNSHRAAVHLERWLVRRYPDASVAEFPGRTGYWVRIRPVYGNHQQAYEIARDLRPSNGAIAYLVRLD